MADIFYGKGIPLTSGFDLGAQSPLDTRTVVNTIEERDEHVTSHRAYIGMKVYVKADHTEYLYTGLMWEKVITLTEEEHQMLVSAYEHSLIDHFSGDYNDLDNLPNLSVFADAELVNQALELKADKDHAHDEYLTDIPLLYAEGEDLDDIQLTVDGLVTKKDLEEYVKKEEIDLSAIHTHANLEVLDLITLSDIDNWNNKSDFSGLYEDLENKPFIPIKLSDLENDLGLITDAALEGYAKLEDLINFVTYDELEKCQFATEQYVDNKILNHDHPIIEISEIDDMFKENE